MAFKLIYKEKNKEEDFQKRALHFLKKSLIKKVFMAL